MNFRKNVIFKKAWRYGCAVPRFFRTMIANRDDYLSSPPLLVNSVPKSGTHLLQQVVSVLPQLNDWGNFWATQPSLTLRERSGKEMAKKIMSVAPGELVCGHLFYSDEVCEALAERNVISLFVYRDPRDVAVSEAYYLANMNKWHRMHKEYKNAAETDRLLLSICGSKRRPDLQPDIRERYEKYVRWIHHPSVYAVSFEALVSGDKEKIVRDIFTHINARTNKDMDVDALTHKALEAIQPKRSHTFRRGESGGWRRDFDDRAKSIFKEVTGDLLVSLGYETSSDW